MWTTLACFALLAVPAITALGISLWNLFVWPRGTSSVEDDADISVLIPARNEQDTIESCIRRAANASPTPTEIIVYDDRSSDDTREILRSLQTELDEDPDKPPLVILDGEPLPEGWVGKPHGCHQLSNAASGDVLLFVDADTRLMANGIARLLSLLNPEGPGPSQGADLVTAVPRQQMVGFAERLLMPLLHLTYTSWLPQQLVYRSEDPRFLAANGQVMMIRRDALRAVGGFEAVRRDVVDDMALGRAFKRQGRTVVFADGFHIAECRMYESGRSLIAGFSKNLYEGIGSSLVALAGVIGLYTAAFGLPYLVVGLAFVPTFASAIPTAVWLSALIGVGANLVLRTILTVRFAHPIEGIILHPLATIGFIAIAVNSGLWHLRDSVRWAGRTYSARSGR